ncbi:WXG100 family type VII secretion target [Micromonospora sp. RL09-050-HVF-A]|uniref:WXG100-like domain-containing protein n=1 Tax=Micromonospora sp. RL09-050-HVF-A TaxID=1703433 RepID=UPI001C5CEF4D|nr:WXG100 family type VII secretion target [Micromonospora sp. RL09-050-HVF-A]MBW4701218.1 WXG100 family type VII secretion target [Micromonospora sp. RL09-050-HVF-A]
MTGNPLVATASDAGPSAWAGIWICEDIELIAQGVRTDSWIDGSLGVVSAGLDALALVSDPVGALLQYGIAWLIEHVKPLSEALDWLAGDPAQITAHAQTWRNVAAALRADAVELTHAVRTEVAGWGGDAGTAYRAWAAGQHQAITGLARGADTLAAATEGAAGLVAAVRLLVRDAIAACVSRLIVYAGELLATGGLATPWVVEQVTTLVGSWAARIARLLRGLLASLRRLLPELRRLGDLIEKLKQALNRLHRGDPASGRNASPPDTPRSSEPPLHLDEEERFRQLGMDPATGRFRPSEAETAAQLERELKVTLSRAPEGSSADWVDSNGRTYDAVGNFPGHYFDQQWPQLQYQIERHLTKADFVPVDVSRFSAEQIATIERFIADRGLGPRVFIVGK